MTLREDTDQYCVPWLGFMLLAAYYFHFMLYLPITDPAYVNAILAEAGAFAGTSLILLLPLVMAFFFLGYLRPARGRRKAPALGLSVFAALIYVMISFQVGGGVFLATWGVGAPLLLAGGFALQHSPEERVTPGIMDVAAIQAKYIPEPEEPEEPEEGEEEVSEEGTPEEPATVQGEPSKIEPEEVDMPETKEEPKEEEEPSSGD